MLGRLDVITIGFLAARLLVVHSPEVHGSPFPRLNLTHALINSIAEVCLTVLPRDLGKTPTPLTAAGGKEGRGFGIIL